MTRLARVRLSLLFPGLLALPACGGEPEYSAVETPVSVSGGGVTIDVVTTQVWQGGFNGAIRIVDTAFPAPITTFQIVFKLGGSAGVSGTGWNGIVAAADGSGNRTATNPDWLQFGPIQIGQTWDVGFNGTGLFTNSTIVSARINNTNITFGGGGGDTTAPTVSLASSASSVTAAGYLTLTATATDNAGGSGDRKSTRLNSSHLG